MFRQINISSLAAMLLLSAQAGVAQGNFWAPSGGPRSAYVGALVIKSADTVFVGTTHGVLRSTDAGESWHEAGLAGVNTEDLKLAPGGEIFAVATDPDTQRLTVYRSLDNGTNWEAAGSGLEGVQQGCLAIAPDGTLYAGGGGGVYRSTDLGDHWVRMSDLIVNKLAVNDRGHIFLYGQHPGHAPESHMFRSTDKGATWVNLATIAGGVTCIAITNRGDIFCGTHDGLYRSTDNGASWESLGDGLTGRQITALAASGGDTLFANEFMTGVARSTDNGKSWATTNLVHKVRALAASADGQVFAGGMSLFHSTNSGESWSPVDVGWSDVDVWDLACGPGDTVYANAIGFGLIGGTDARGFFRSTDNGASWREMATPYITWFWVSPHGHLFACHNGMEAGKYYYRSTDGGEHWTLYPHLYPSGVSFRDPVFNDSGDIFALSEDWGMVRSTDDGDTWTNMSTGLGNRIFSSLAISGAGVVFAGGDTGHIFRSTNNGASWDPVSFGLASPTSRVARLATGAEGEVFAEVVQDGTGAKVYHSTTGGAEWTLLDSLPDPSTDMFVDAAGNLFVSFWDLPPGPVGVYRNGVPINSGLTDSSVNCLDMDSRGYLFAATRRGVFRSTQTITAVKEHPSAQLPVTFVLEQNYPNPFNPKTVVGSHLPVVSNVRIVIYDLLGREVKVLVNERRAAGRYDDTFDGSDLASGIYIYRLKAGSFTQSRMMILLK